MNPGVQALMLLIYIYIYIYIYVDGWQVAWGIVQEHRARPWQHICDQQR